LGTTAFWGITILIVLILFRNEIKRLISSLGRFNIGSNNFEFNDKKAEIQTYINLSDILIDLLSDSARGSQLKGLIDSKNAQLIKKFVMKYTEEISPKDWNLELLKNCALILSLRQFTNEALVLIEKLKKENPDDLDFLNLKAICYSNRKKGKDLENAEKIYSEIIDKAPYVIQYYLNRAITRSEMKNLDGAIQDLKDVRKMGYIGKFTDPGFFNLKNYKPAEWKSLTNQQMDDKLLSK